MFKVESSIVPRCHCEEDAVRRGNPVNNALCRFIPGLPRSFRPPHNKAVDNSLFDFLSL